MKIIWLTFITIFIAELGDKTQLAVLALKGKGYNGLEIFLGAMLAFAVLTLLAIILGDWLQGVVDPELIEKVAAGAFVVVGVLMWFEIL